MNKARRAQLNGRLRVRADTRRGGGKNDNFYNGSKKIVISNDSSCRVIIVSGTHRGVDLTRVKSNLKNESQALLHDRTHCVCVHPPIPRGDEWSKRWHSTVIYGPLSAHSYQARAAAAAACG